MIRETVVDGEPVLDVDTAEDLDHTLTNGVYVLAPHDVLTEYGLTDTENSDTQDIVDGSDWRDAAWLGSRRGGRGPKRSSPSGAGTAPMRADRRTPRKPFGGTAWPPRSMT